MSEPVKQTEENAIGKGKPGPGRPKGSSNRVTKAIREMIVEALENKGGVEYLERQADENPTAFLTLVGKVLPLQLTGEDGGAIVIQKIERTYHKPQAG